MGQSRKIPKKPLSLRTRTQGQPPACHRTIPNKHEGQPTRNDETKGGRKKTVDVQRGTFPNVRIEKKKDVHRTHSTVNAQIEAKKRGVDCVFFVLQKLPLATKLASIPVCKSMTSSFEHQLDCPWRERDFTR